MHAGDDNLDIILGYHLFALGLERAGILSIELLPPLKEHGE